MKICKSCKTSWNDFKYEVEKDGRKYTSDYCSMCRKAYGRMQQDQGYQDELRQLVQDVDQDRVEEALKRLLAKLTERQSELQEMEQDVSLIQRRLQRLSDDVDLTKHFLLMFREG